MMRSERTDLGCTVLRSRMAPGEAGSFSFHWLAAQLSQPIAKRRRAPDDHKIFEIVETPYLLTELIETVKAATVRNR
jgi:hypothetical protein